MVYVTQFKTQLNNMECFKTVEDTISIALVKHCLRWH